MKVSIITATYNSEQTVYKTLHSISCQNYNNIEHIVVDGKSQDDTLAIVQKFSHVNKVISEPDNGIYDALNKGIKHSSGDIIGILHSDDYFKNSEVLSDVIEKFKTDNCDALYADLQYVKSKNNKLKIIRNWKSGVYREKKWLYGWMPPHPTFFVKKEIYDLHGLFVPTLFSSADYELMLRLMYKEKIKVSYLPKVLIQMEVGGQSNASIKNRIFANREDLKSWELNDLKPYWFTTKLKPLRKLTQYIIK
ncbi:MAG: glycosyltransferase family 2 protein [Bacteroidota bacterium]|nr:glycosyltransferase family 2 protein [Bacteroidota bacterium]MEC8739282.1 glycosyltransferase family 2 protein [Bacteroidota bacterium]